MTASTLGALPLHRLKKVEIVLRAEDRALVEDLLRAAGVGGWTMIRDVAGMGHGGFHQGKTIFNDQSGLVMFMGVAEPAAIAAGAAADPSTLSDLSFAWRACRSVKSNAILAAKDGAAVGVGMGQVNRVDSARLAVERAGHRIVGSVVASDAFFPFADGLQVLIDAGVSAVVQPGGSVRDEEVIAAANAAGITMYLTSTRHFFH